MLCEPAQARSKFGEGVESDRQITNVGWIKADDINENYSSAFLRPQPAAGGLPGRGELLSPLLLDRSGPAIGDFTIEEAVPETMSYSIGSVMPEGYSNSR